MDDDTKKDEDVVEETATPQEDVTPVAEAPADADSTEETAPTEEAPKTEESAESSESVEPPKDDGYQFDDDIDLSASTPPPTSQPTNSYNAGGGGGRFADELFSKTVHAKFRTFYVDLKESRNGKFVKISEKSKGRKSTIMMDAEDVPQIIEALQEVQGKL